MAGNAEVRSLGSLAARRQALVSESEAYRHSLALELQNLRLYTARAKQRFQLLNAAKPLLVVLPFLGGWFAKKPTGKSPKKPHGWRRWLGAALAGWRVYRSASPFLGTLASFRDKRRTSRRPEFRTH